MCVGLEYVFSQMNTRFHPELASMLQYNILPLSGGKEVLEVREGSYFHLLLSVLILRSHVR